MAGNEVYSNNSKQKDYIRDRWIDFASDIYTGAVHDFGILTFPAEAMQDLRLFKEKGFIDWEEVETESPDGTPNYKVTKGKVRCFEKKNSIYKILNQRLIHAKVNNDDFCSYVKANYTRIIAGSDKTFPVDVVNLDFEGRLYPNSAYPFEGTMKCVFEFQKNHKQNFSLFLTWPVVEVDDLNEYKNLLHSVIESNLIDPSAQLFKQSFEENIGTIGDLKYEKKSVVGVTKVIIKKASQSLYALQKSEFYVYGGKGNRQRMISLLFNFKYEGKIGHENIIYAKDVAKSMGDIVNVDDALAL